MKGLIIKSPWIDLILQGKKTWEIRGSNTSIRGRIGLIQSGTGMVYGTVELVDSKHLNLDEYQHSAAYHRIEVYHDAPYERIHAWVLANPVRWAEPVPYVHPRGAVIWVNLQYTSV